MTVLQNHVILENDIPARLHFRDHRLGPRTITDPTTGKPAIRNTLEFNADRLDGRSVESVLSTMADGLADKFEPYLGDKSYRNYEVIITQRGEGFTRKWTVLFIPMTTR